MKKKVLLYLALCSVLLLLPCGCQFHPVEQVEDSAVDDEVVDFLPRAVPAVVQLPGGLTPTDVANATHVVLGMSYLDISSSNPFTIGIQVDRGIRDIHDPGMWYDERVPPDYIPTSPAQLVPYMEGLRAAELWRWTGSPVIPLGPCKAQQREPGYWGGLGWFGSDGQGNYPFYILDDKIDNYWTTTIATEGGVKYATIVDTHGFSAIAQAAYTRKVVEGKKLDLAIACMDFPTKADAAYYLAQHGIVCYAPCDRFTYTLLARMRDAPPAAKIFGSAPVVQTATGARIGGQPVAIGLSETVIAQYTTAAYPNQYYDTASRYFDEFKAVFGRSPKVVKIDAVEGQSSKLVKAAQKYKSNVIAARVYVKSDYTPLYNWLKGSTSRRLILFHSAAYDYGILLMRQFPNRVSFGDLEPVFAR